jgi:hypothetical protein
MRTFIDYTYNNSDDYHEDFKECCLTGDLDKAKLIYETRESLNVAEDDSLALDNAVKNKHLTIVQWLCSIHDFNVPALYYRACNQNYEELLQWLLIEKSDIEIGVQKNALHCCYKNDNLSLAKILYNIFPNTYDEITYNLYYYDVSLETFKWFSQTHKQQLISYNIFNYCCITGKLDFCKYISSNMKLKIGLETYVKTCANNHLNVIKWLHDQYTMSTYIVQQCLLSIGHSDNLEILIWLNTLYPMVDLCNAIPCQICTISCKNGYLNIVKWLYDHNYFTIVFHKHQITESYNAIFRVACENGHLPIVVWILDLHPDIVIRDQDFFTACDKGYLDLCKWLLDFKSELLDNFNYKQLCANILRKNKNEYLIIQWLYTINPEILWHINSRVFYRYITINLDFCKWLFDVNPKIIDVYEAPIVSSIFTRRSEDAIWLATILPRKQLLALFLHSCVHDSLNKCKWLYTKIPNISTDMDTIWNLCLNYGKTIICDWLHEIEPLQFNDKIDKEFKRYCHSGKESTILWLSNNCDKYTYEIKKNGGIRPIIY